MAKTQYHLFATTMEGLREKVWSYDRLEHWASGDGIHWNRSKVLFRPLHDKETGLWRMRRSLMSGMVLRRASSPG
jgi:hypothetical protein